MLETNDAVFVLVDVQGKLAACMDGREALYRQLQRLVHGMQVLRIPILWMEQVPDKMGPTIPELTGLLGGREPIVKQAFSCCGSDAFVHGLVETHRRQVVLAGIETHVCVYQTARDLVRRGYAVEVVADAVSSRSPLDRRVGLERIAAEGARIATVEMVLLDLVRTAAHPAFRDILNLIK